MKNFSKVTNSIKTSAKLSSLFASLLVVPTLTLADADIAVQPSGTATEATTNVDICVVIPEILIFGVGEVGDTVSKIAWTLDNAAGVGFGNNQTYSGAAAPFTAPAPFSTTVTAAVTTGATGSSVSGATATLPVFLFANSGNDVSIEVDISGGIGGGGAADVLENAATGQTIPISEFTSGDGGSITHPALTSSTTATTATNAAGIVNVSDSWTYTYTPASIPTAGTYDARITYVASQP